jgi:molecular chaperone DnaJ
VREHSTFHRERDDLFCEVPISFPEAALGAQIEVPTLEGGTTKLSIPEGTQPGTVLRVRHQGVPHLGSRGRGDLHVVVRLSVPTRLSSEQRELVEQLRARLAPAERKPKDKGLKDRVKSILS